MHPLSFLILLEPGLNLIYRVLGAGIDVNGTGRDLATETPLRAAAQTRDLTLVKELIFRGASINDTQCGSMYTPLQLACGTVTSRHSCSFPCTCFRDKNHHFACKQVRLPCGGPVHFDMAEYLLANGADPNATGASRGETPLQLALLSQSPDVRLIDLLLKSGADVNALTWSSVGITPRRSFILKVALREAHHLGTHKQRIVEMLIDRGAEVNARWISHEERLGASPIEATCESHSPDCIHFVKLLLDRGAELNPPPEYTGSTALDIACKKRDIDLIKLLLDRGMDPNPKTSADHGPLAVAAAKGDLVIAIMLLAAGAKVTVGSVERSEYSCPLVAAAKLGRLDMVALLLDLETREEAVEQAISSAQEEGYLAIASYIQPRLDKSISPPQMQAAEIRQPQSKYQDLGKSSTAAFEDLDASLTSGAWSEHGYEGIGLMSL